MINWIKKLLGIKPKKADSPRKFVYGRKPGANGVYPRYEFTSTGAYKAKLPEYNWNPGVVSLNNQSAYIPDNSTQTDYGNSLDLIPSHFDTGFGGGDYSGSGAGGSWDDSGSSSSDYSSYDSGSSDSYSSND